MGVLKNYYLKGYFDDSGHESDPNIITSALGGYVATEDDWVCFEREWKKVLLDHDVPFLHMREYSHHLGPFKKYEHDRQGKNSLIKSLIGVIENSGLIGFVSSIYLNDLNAINEHSRERNKFMAYSINLYSCVWCISNNWPNISIELICDKTEKFHSKKENAEVYAKRNNHYYEKYKYINVCELNGHLSSMDLVQLQAADLLAYEITKENRTIDELIKGTYKREVISFNQIKYAPRRKSMQRLLRHTKINNNFEWTLFPLAFLMKSGGYLNLNKSNRIDIKLSD